MANLPQHLQTFAERLRTARITAGLTQQQAAEQTGKIQANWSAMECGTWLPDVAYRRALERFKTCHANMETIAKVVNLTVEDLIG